MANRGAGQGNSGRGGDPRNPPVQHDQDNSVEFTVKVSRGYERRPGLAGMRASLSCARTLGVGRCVGVWPGQSVI